jgi:hypothetical protein
MSFCRLNAFGVVIYLCVGCLSKFQLASEQDSLEGVWQVHSVCRDGKLDSRQVGAQLTFAKDAVSFQPKVREFVDMIG